MNIWILNFSNTVNLSIYGEIVSLDVYQSILQKFFSRKILSSSIIESESESAEVAPCIFVVVEFDRHFAATDCCEKRKSLTLS